MEKKFVKKIQREERDEEGPELVVEYYSCNDPVLVLVLGIDCLSNLDLNEVSEYLVHRKGIVEIEV
jgi:hypothetical protein